MVFRRTFDLKFQQLKKDECNQCATYNALTEKTEAQKIEESNHLEDKEIAEAKRRSKKQLKRGNCCFRFGASALDSIWKTFNPVRCQTSFYKHLMT